MKKRKIITLLVLGTPLIIYLLTIGLYVPSIDGLGYQTIIGAHRGDSIEYTENTIPAIKNAIENKKYQFIEFDLRLTKDNKIILFHDQDLLRMELIPKKISELNYSEIEKITEFHIPQYSETIELIPKTKKTNIEIKTCGNLTKDKKLLDFIVNDSINRGIIKNIMISSPTNEIIGYSKEKYPHIKTGKIHWILPSTYIHTDKFTQLMYTELENINADYLMIHIANIHNIERLLKLKPKNKTLVLWDFKDEMYIIQKDKTDSIW